MRKALLVLALTTAGVLVATPADGATRNVSTAAQYRQALTDLSALSSGTHTINITADFTLVADNEPTYTGTRPLVIDGGGHVVDGNDANRLIDHNSTARLTVRDLTFVHGEAPVSGLGGAIEADGRLDVVDSHLNLNQAANDGGAVAAYGNLTITRSELSNNYSGSGGGAVLVGAPANLTITGSTLNDNEAAGVGGGAIRHVGDGTATISTSTFRGNQATGNLADGGALFFENEGGITLTDLTVEDNQAFGGAGGGAYSLLGAVTVTGGEWTQNTVSAPSGPPGGARGGGALYTGGPTTIDGTTFGANTVTDAPGGAVALTDSEGSVVRRATFTTNQTLGTTGGRGGALYVGGDDEDFLVSDSLFLDNEAAGTNGDGGGIYLPYGTVQDSVLSDNAVAASGAEGGGISSPGGVLVLRRSTVFNNEAAGPGGRGGGLSVEEATIEQSTLWANDAQDEGGGLWVNHAVTLENTTVHGNTAGTGGGLYADGAVDVDLVHATLTGNDGDGGANLFADFDLELTSHASLLAEPETGPDCELGEFAVVDAETHNVESGTSCDFDDVTDQQGVTDPGLGRLRTNGGPTPTRFPLAGSVLVDVVPAGSCPSPVDQQGVGRPFAGSCDVGAVEQVYPDHDFSDVPAWVEDGVRWITYGDDPLMEGFANGTFRAGDPITRAQVVRLLHRAAGEPDPLAYGPHPFTDVPAWVEDAVRWAYGEGIVTGETPTTFAPDDPITRAQVTRMVHRFAGSPPVGAIDPHPFTDVPAWVEDAVRWAANTDNPLPLVTGITPTTFEPADDITRGQVVRMIWRLALTPDAWLDDEVAPTTMLFQGNLA
jgi:hypothetical protein